MDGWRRWWYRQMGGGRGRERRGTWSHMCHLMAPVPEKHFRHRWWWFCCWCMEWIGTGRQHRNLNITQAPHHLKLVWYRAQNLAPNHKAANPHLSLFIVDGNLQNVSLNILVAMKSFCVEKGGRGQISLKIAVLLKVCPLKDVLYVWNGVYTMDWLHIGKRVDSARPLLVFSVVNYNELWYGVN